MAEFHHRYMNTFVSTSGINPPDAQRVFDRMAAAEQRYSRFTVNSELSRVNGQAGQETPVSQSFAALFFEALRFYAETDGIFNPFLGNVMRSIGYDRSFEQVDRHHALRHNVPPTAKQSSFTFDLEKQTITLPADIALDFGGIAKGWTVQSAAQSLLSMRRPRGLINAGGDLMGWTDSDHAHWTIDVSHPFSDHQSIGRIAFDSGQLGVATSSTIKRSWSDGTQLLHHLIDPRTGLPAASNIIQATVAGPKLLPCEIYAKCLLILGSSQGPAWLAAKHPKLSYVFVDQSGKITASEATNMPHIRVVFLKQIDIP